MAETTAGWAVAVMDASTAGVVVVVAEVVEVELTRVSVLPSREIDRYYRTINVKYAIHYTKSDNQYTEHVEYCTTLVHTSFNSTFP